MSKKKQQARRLVAEAFRAIGHDDKWKPLFQDGEFAKAIREAAYCQMDTQAQLNNWPEAGVVEAVAFCIIAHLNFAARKRAWHVLHCEEDATRGEGPFAKLWHKRLGECEPE
jgi:hypothetical protein